jgi:hypothetical protein
MEQPEVVVLGRDLSQVKEGDHCPYQDNGVFQLKVAGDGRRKFLVCSVNEEHWRWQPRRKTLPS